MFKAIRKAISGIDWIFAVLKTKPKTITRVGFYRIPHKDPQKEDIALKIGRYHRDIGQSDELECSDPKSELTLDSEEFLNLIVFLEENYEPFKQRANTYIPVKGSISVQEVQRIRQLLADQDKRKLAELLLKENVLSDDVLNAISLGKRKIAISEFEKMLGDEAPEREWQAWFERNPWVFGSDFVQILDARTIDPKHVADYLTKAHDGFVDLIEIKRPKKAESIWSKDVDHDNFFPSPALSKGITQAANYLLELERQSDSIKFFERLGRAKIIKPRAVLVIGRSDTWGEDELAAQRLLNSTLHNLTILTYDQVLERARSMLTLDNK